MDLILLLSLVDASAQFCLTLTYRFWLFLKCFKQIFIVEKIKFINLGKLYSTFLSI